MYNRWCLSGYRVFYGFIERVCGPTQELIHMSQLPCFVPLRKNVPDYSASKEKNDLGFITFDLEAELTPLFNWNVKQLFLYLTAEYTTATNVS